MPSLGMKFAPLRLLLLALLLIGCASKYGDLSPDGEGNLLRRLGEGHAVLDCGLSCAGEWEAERHTLRHLYDTSQWAALALGVMQIGYEDGLAWYYLGRAAEGLGEPDAARIYYTQALTVAHSCKDLFNICDGFVFPVDVQHRLAALATAAPRPGSLGPRAGIALTGSAFFVNGNGTLVTNAHVVEGCGRVRIAGGDGAPLTIDRIDETSDIALIEGPRSPHFLLLRDGKPIRPGDSVVAIGFPLKGLLASEANVTTGTVSALAGLRDSPGMMQISAPVQAGNSGGPLIDDAGNVVGVVVSKLDAMKVAAQIGDLPQNINFAVKVSRLRELLDSADLSYATAASSKHLGAGDVAERTMPAVVALECWH
jgi:hypothetical protein